MSDAEGNTPADYPQHVSQHHKTLHLNLYTPMVRDHKSCELARRSVHNFIRFHLSSMDNQRFIVNPFKQLLLTPDACTKLVEITDEIIMAKFEEYEEYLDINKEVDLQRWKKHAKSGLTTTYLERKHQNPDSKLPQSLMVGPLPGTLDENMFGLVNPTIESMRIKSSYLNDFNAAAVLATILEPTVDDPFRSVVVKWMEIDIPLASLGLVRNRDYVCIESTGILHLQNGERVGYHLLHSVTFPEVHELPNRVRGHMSFCGIFHQEGPDRTDCRGTGILNPGGDMVRAMAVMGMVQATMAGVKYSYCGQMKKLAWLLEQRQGDGRERGTLAYEPNCVTCAKSVSASKLRGATTCKLCFGAVCSACKILKKMSFITPDLTLLQRKVHFCVKCMVRATQMDTQEVAREQLNKTTGSPTWYGASMPSPSTCSESTMTW